MAMASTTKPLAPEQGVVDLESLVRSNEANLNAWFRSQGAAFTGCAAIHQEVMSFATGRMRRGFEVSDSLIQCGSPQEAIRLECAFVQKAHEDYLKEAGQLVGLLNQLIRDCWPPLDHGTRGSLDKATAGSAGLPQTSSARSSSASRSSSST